MTVTQKQIRRNSIKRSNSIDTFQGAGTLPNSSKWRLSNAVCLVDCYQLLKTEDKAELFPPAWASLEDDHDQSKDISVLRLQFQIYQTTLTFLVADGRNKFSHSQKGRVNPEGFQNCPLIKTQNSKEAQAYSVISRQVTSNPRSGYFIKTLMKERYCNTKYYQGLR